MKLIEAIRDCEMLDEEAIIFAVEPWTEDSAAAVEREPETGGIPENAQRLGMKYFLEIFIVRGFFDDWAANPNTEPSLSEKCKQIIHYAIYDA